MADVGQWVQIGQSVVMMVATVFAWLWGRQQKAEKDVLEGQFRRITERQFEHEEEFNRRIERINEQLSSKLAPSVQLLMTRIDRMPDELRGKFLPLDRAMDLIEESRRDRTAIWEELQKRGNRGGPRYDAHK